MHEKLDNPHLVTNRFVAQEGMSELEQPQGEIRSQEYMR